MQKLTRLPTRKVLKEKLFENKCEKKKKKIAQQDIFHGCFQGKIVVAYYEAFMLKATDRKLLFYILICLLFLSSTVIPIPVPDP